jgi:hypothetical protein
VRPDARGKSPAARKACNEDARFLRNPEVGHPKKGREVGWKRSASARGDSGLSIRA